MALQHYRSLGLMCALAGLGACSTLGGGKVAPPPPLEPVIAELEEPVQCEGMNFLVYFERDQTDLDAAALKVIDDIVASEAGCTLSSIEIEGHADSAGSEAVNLAVSKRRALAVKEALLKADLIVEQVDIIAAGEAYAKTPTGETVPMNRKVKVVFRQ